MAGSGTEDIELAEGARERSVGLGQQAVGLFWEVFLPGLIKPCYLPLSQSISPVTGVCPAFP